MYIPIIIWLVFYAVDSIKATIYDVHGREKEELEQLKRSIAHLILLALALFLSIVKSLFL